MQKRYEYESQRIKDLDAKAGNLIGYVGIITGLILGLGPFGLLEKFDQNEILYLYLAGVTSFSISICLALYAVKITSYQFRPDYEYILEILQLKFSNYCEVITKHILNMAVALEMNRQTNNTKAKRIRLSWFFLLLG